MPRGYFLIAATPPGSRPAKRPAWLTHVHSNATHCLFTRAQTRMQANQPHATPDFLYWPLGRGGGGKAYPGSAAPTSNSAVHRVLNQVMNGPSPASCSAIRIAAAANIGSSLRYVTRLPDHTHKSCHHHHHHRRHHHTSSSNRMRQRSDWGRGHTRSAFGLVYHRISVLSGVDSETQRTALYSTAPTQRKKAARLLGS